MTEHPKRKSISALRKIHSLYLLAEIIPHFLDIEICNLRIRT